MESFPFFSFAGMDLGGWAELSYVPPRSARIHFLQTRSWLIGLLRSSGRQSVVFFFFSPLFFFPPPLLYLFIYLYFFGSPIAKAG